LGLTNKKQIKIMASYTFNRPEVFTAALNFIKDDEE